MQLVTKSFANQCLAFPDKVETALAEVETADQAKDILDQAATMQAYAKQLKAGVALEKPIAAGVLKIKAKLGEMLPRGKGGPGNNDSYPLGSINKNTATAYRKIAEHEDKLDEYCEWVTEHEIPTQEGFLRYCSEPHVSNNSGCNEWYTPPKYIEAARRVMGGIDLDPCSSEVAQEYIKADIYYTIDDDGLEYVWAGRVWMNPPYGRELVERFCEEVVDQFDSGSIDQACVLVNNATETNWFQNMMSSACSVCFITGRVKFLNEDGEEAKTPLQGQAVLYFGKRMDAFLREFSELGICLVRR